MLINNEEGEKMTPFEWLSRMLKNFRCVCTTANWIFNNIALMLNWTEESHVAMQYLVIQHHLFCTMRLTFLFRMNKLFFILNSHNYDWWLLNIIMHAKKGLLLFCVWIQWHAMILINELILCIMHYLYS